MRVEIIDCSKTREIWRSKRRRCRASAANALTTRTPETFSSTSAVSSASRCWTSCSAGRERRPYRAATKTTNGTGARLIAASGGLTMNIATADSRIVSADWIMKTSP